jgi:hypothetical protein
MSGTVRILALLFGAVLFAGLYFGLGIAWYLAIPVGILAFMIIPIWCDWVDNKVMRHRLAGIIKKARDRKENG